MFDQDGKGYVSELDLNQKFEELMLNADSKRIMSLFDRDRDGQLSPAEFMKLITPMSLDYQLNRSLSRSDPSGQFLGLSRDVKSFDSTLSFQLRNAEWIDDLKEVFYTASRAQEFLQEVRANLAIDGAYLFSLIDSYRLGYLSTRNITEWLLQTVGFKLNELEGRIILNRYDKDGDYKINLGEFIEEVTPINVPEIEDDMEEGVNENSGDMEQEDGRVEGDEHSINGSQARLEEGYPEGHAEGSNDEVHREGYEDEEFDSEEDQHQRDEMLRRYSAAQEDLDAEAQAEEALLQRDEHNDSQNDDTA